MEQVFSNSEISTVKRCRRKWMLTYYHQLGYPAGKFVPTGPMHIGIAIHDALEAKYGHDEDPLSVLKDIYEWHMMQWSGDPQASTDIAKDHEMARIMVEGYLEWAADEGIDALIEITGAEIGLSASVHSGWTLLGKLDVQGVHKINGFKFFLDHKTVGDLKKPVEGLELNEQFPTYGILQQLNSTPKDEVADGGYVNMLRRVKRTVRANPPFYGREPVHFNKYQLSSMWRRIRAVLTEIIDMRRRLDAGEDHREVAYPTPTGDCAWDCIFRKICPLLDDGSRWEDALKAEYTVIENPYSRYTDPPLREVAREGLRNKVTPGTVA